MSIYNKYEERGLLDYKLKTVEDVKELHKIDISKVKGLNLLSDEDRELAIRLIINYLNGFGCGSRKDVPTKIEKLDDYRFKVLFKDGGFSYLYRNGTVG